jgi:hypothetical protein
VREVRSGVREEARSCGLVVGEEEGEEGVHHFRTSFCCEARSTHGAIFASWSMLDTIISSPSENCSAKETLRNSCEVEGPKTFCEEGCVC